MNIKQVDYNLIKSYISENLLNQVAKIHDKYWIAPTNKYLQSEAMEAKFYNIMIDRCRVNNFFALLITKNPQ